MTAPDAAQACPSVEVTPGPVGEPFGASGAQVDPTTCAVLTWSWALEYAGGLIRGRSAELVLRRDGEATTWAALTIDERAWVRSAVGATRSGVADAFARGFLRGEPLPAGPFAAPTRIAPTIIDDLTPPEKNNSVRVNRGFYMTPPGERRAYMHAVWKRTWGEGRDAMQDALLGEIAADMNWEPTRFIQQADSDEAAQALGAATEAAIREGLPQDIVVHAPADTKRTVLGGCGRACGGLRARS